MDPPAGGVEYTQSMTARCRRQPKEDDPSVFYYPLTCEDFGTTREACGWPQTQESLAVLQCELGHGGCETKEDCELAGRCPAGVSDAPRSTAVSGRR